MAPKVICGSPMTQICISEGEKLPKIAKNPPEFVCALNAPKDHLGVVSDSILHFFLQRMAKNVKNWTKTSNFLVLQIPQNSNIWFCHKCSQKSFDDQDLHIFGPILFAHASTNTAAYKCISLFWNTFLPSGKAVLVKSVLQLKRYDWQYKCLIIATYKACQDHMQALWCD